MTINRHFQKNHISFRVYTFNIHYTIISYLKDEKSKNHVKQIEKFFKYDIFDRTPAYVIISKETMFKMQYVNYIVYKYKQRRMNNFFSDRCYRGMHEKLYLKKL